MSEAPRHLDIVYAPGPDDLGWTGSCAAFAGLSATGRSIHQVDLQLAPMLSRALEARHGQALSVSVLPGGEEHLSDGRRTKRLPVGPASLSCTMTP